MSQKATGVGNMSLVEFGHRFCSDIDDRAVDIDRKSGSLASNKNYTNLGQNLSNVLKTLVHVNHLLSKHTVHDEEKYNVVPHYTSKSITYHQQNY